MAEPTKDETTTTDEQVPSQDQFDNSAAIGQETAEKNLAAEAEENTVKSGEENVEAEVKTSDAQEELKPEGDDTPTEDVTGDDKDAQNPKKVLDGGRKDAKSNLSSEAKEQPEVAEDKTSTEDAIEAGRRTAEKNHKAEVKANNEANAARRADSK